MNIKIYIDDEFHSEKFINLEGVEDLAGFISEKLHNELSKEKFIELSLIDGEISAWYKK